VVTRTCPHRSAHILVFGARTRYGPAIMSTSHRAWKWLLIIVTLVTGPSYAWSFTSDKRETLRGLTEISVLVEYLPDEIEREGLRREQLKRDIELRLQEAGLRVLPLTEIAAASGSPYLYVSIAMSASPTITSASAIPTVSLTFKQLAHLSRSPTTEFFATTWEGPVFQALSTTNRIADIHSKLSDAVGRFLIDYRAVNSK